MNLIHPTLTLTLKKEEEEREPSHVAEQQDFPRFHRRNEKNVKVLETHEWKRGCSGNGSAELDLSSIYHNISGQARSSLFWLMYPVAQVKP